MSHTPGDWKYFPDCNEVCVVDPDGDFEFTICELGDLRCHARDGLLIAAAPDLLTACELVERWWLEHAMEQFDGAPAAIFKVREAIKKAKGNNE